MTFSIHRCLGPHCRFAEWSAACVNMQLKALNEDPKAMSVHYFGVYLQDDAAIMEKNMSTVRAEFLRKWFDHSEQAGPARRPASAFGEPIPALEILTVADNQLKILCLVSVSHLDSKIIFWNP